MRAAERLRLLLAGRDRRRAAAFAELDAAADELVEVSAELSGWSLADRAADPIGYKLASLEVESARIRATIAAHCRPVRRRAGVL